MMIYTYKVVDLTTGKEYVENGEFDSYRDFLAFLYGMSQLYSGQLRYIECKKNSELFCDNS